jgi:mRNA-degrading endonuclease RelE of RelBE toxin-antitoxin system
MSETDAVTGVEIEPSAKKALKKLHKTDVQAARRIQRLVDQILAGETPRGSVRMTNGQATRGRFGALPWKVAHDKLRVIFIPGKSIVALGYRKEVYTVLDGNGWGN